MHVSEKWEEDEGRGDNRGEVGQSRGKEEWGDNEGRRKRGPHWPNPTGVKNKFSRFQWGQL